MKKANLISAINTQLTAIITQAKVRLASSLLLDEVYPSVVHDTNLASTVLIKNDTLNLAYDVSIVKTGRMVFLKGIIKNNELTDIDDSNANNFFFKISNDEFLPNLASIYDNKTVIVGGESVELLPTLIVGSSEYFVKLYVSNLVAGASTSFNLFYPTKN